MPLLRQSTPFRCRMAQAVEMSKVIGNRHLPTLARTHARTQLTLTIAQPAYKMAEKSLARPALLRRTHRLFVAPSAWRVSTDGQGE